LREWGVESVLTSSATLKFLFMRILTSFLQGTSAGAKDQEADNFLEKRFENNPQFSYEETVQTAIAALQNVLSEDFKATEIEVWKEYLCIILREALSKARCRIDRKERLVSRLFVICSSATLLDQISFLACFPAVI